MLRIAIFICFICSIWAPGWSQDPEPRFRENELLVQLEKGTDLQTWMNTPQRASKSSVRTILARKNIHLLKFNAKVDLEVVLRNLQQDDQVIHVQYNRILQRRGGTTLPNDPFFTSQWNLDRIGLSEIWDETTGGITPCGDTVVIAVNDFGMDVNHEDLEDILWTNTGEIPNNSFDDDDNGYVDDYLGLNLDTGDDKHQIDSGAYHGTSVASIISSATDNGKGIAGINWHVKLLVISSEEKDEAQAIEAFEYARALRKKYNDSGGSEGAYIVAMNNSWGYEGGFEDEFPILCGMFDDLGEVGILTVGSTENDEVNTDFFGDIPSDCSSDFLIVVTNSDESDELSVAGFGKENVDLSAPGEGIYAAGMDNDYRTYGGTSYAAPHVSGAIGLLYSLPQAVFCDNARISPEETILEVKRYMMDGTTPLPSLQDKTVSGGRLDLLNTVDMVTSSREHKIRMSVFPNPALNEIRIETTEVIPAGTISVFDPLGKLIYDNDTNGQPNFSIDIRSWPQGTYFITLRSGDDFGFEKMVKM